MTAPFLSPSAESPNDDPGLRKIWKELHFDIPLEDATALHIVLLHSERWLRKQRLCAGQIVNLNLPQIRYKGQALLTKASPAEWAPSSEGEIKAVFLRDADEDNGVLVLGARRSRQMGSFVERCGSLRMVALEFIERRGQMARLVNIQMLRSVDWMQEHQVRIGGSVFLDEPSEGVTGSATVRGIRPCPSREEWLEKMSFGEYRPWSCRVGDLKIACEQETIGVTPYHPFWCPNKNDWVAAGRLEPGDFVQTENGLSPVEWYVMREKPEVAVYNIEVEGDHVYRVGESGILVHNASAGVAQQNDPCPKICIIVDGVMGPYVDLEQDVISGKENTEIKEGLDFEGLQKRRIRAENMATNGNKLISDCYPVHGKVPVYCGTWIDTHQELSTPLSGRFMGGKARPLNEAQVDHIKPQSARGSNSYCNAVLISFELNNRKRAH